MDGEDVVGGGGSTARCIQQASALKAGLVYAFVSMVQDGKVMHAPLSIDFDIVGSIELLTIKLSSHHRFPLYLGS
jgi:hypothetical protein